MAGKRTMSLAALIETYERQPMTMERFFDGMTDAQLRRRPTAAQAKSAGRWSCIELLGHLADTEQVYADRIKRTIAMDRPLVIGFDEDAYVEKLASAQRDLEEEIELIWVTRSQVARILRTLPAAAWERQAVHNKAGLQSLRKLVETMVWHHDHHLSFVRKKRGAMEI